MTSESHVPVPIGHVLLRRTVKKDKRKLVGQIFQDEQQIIHCDSKK